MQIILFLSAVAFFASIAWFIKLPGFDSGIAIVTSLIALIGTFISEKKRKLQAVQTQSIAEDGVGIQAGGDVSIGSILTNKKAHRDAE